MNNGFRKTLLCAGWICVISSPIGTALASPQYPLSYMNAIEFALENHTDLAVEKANVKKAAASLGEARAAFLPSVEIFTTMERTKAYDTFTGINMIAHYNGADIPIDVTSTTPAYQINPGIELKYNLYSGGVDRARLNDVQASKDAAEGQQALARKKVVLDVTTAYWELRKQQVEYQTAERNQDYAREELTFSTEQFRQGSIARIDLEGKALATETRDMQLRAALRRLSDAQRRYAYALGLTPETTSLQTSPSHLLTDHPAQVEIDKLLAKVGLMGEPEMRIAQAGYEGAKARIEQAQAEYKPSIDFYAHYTGNGRSEGSFDHAASDFHRGNASIGVRFKWNLFDGYRADYRTAQALTAAEQMALRIKQIRRELNNDWLEKQLREAETRDRLLLARKQRDLSSNELTIAAKRLETKMISKLQYHAAQLALDEAESRETVAEIDLLLASVAFRLAQYVPEHHSDVGKQYQATESETMPSSAMEAQPYLNTSTSGMHLKMTREIGLRSIEKVYSNQAAP